MTLSDLRNIYDKSGYYTAASAIERDELMSPAEVDDLFEELERLHEQHLRRWTHPSRYPAAYDRHEF